MIPTRTCSNFDEELESLLGKGYRLDMIMPADSPREAIVSKGDDSIRLVAEANPQSAIPNPKSVGRAGMEYRDLIPDRLDGRVIASHIRITTDGEVPDYVHYHKIDFQMIYCRAGRIRVVYEDQGPPFVLEAGDYVLQPPEIRHRVLEATAGSEVVEITSPAVHETWVEHEIELPTADFRPARLFGNQTFLRHAASDAVWKTKTEGVEICETGIATATNGAAAAAVIKLAAEGEVTMDAVVENARDALIFVLVGRVKVDVDGDTTKELATDGSMVIGSPKAKLTAAEDSEILVVTLPEG